VIPQKQNYSVEVALPEQLTTTYQKKLEYKEEMCYAGELHSKIRCDYFFHQFPELIEDPLEQGQLFRNDLSVALHFFFVFQLLLISVVNCSGKALQQIVLFLWDHRDVSTIPFSMPYSWLRIIIQFDVTVCPAFNLPEFCSGKIIYRSLLLLGWYMSLLHHLGNGLVNIPVIEQRNNTIKRGDYQIGLL